MKIIDLKASFALKNSPSCSVGTREADNMHKRRHLKTDLETALTLVK